ncbi:MAG: nitrogen regulation protein NR(II) [Pseudomonadota bacterium]
MSRDRHILDNLSTAVVVLGTDLRVTAVNAAGEALLDTSETRCVGQHARNLVSEPPEWLEKLEQARSGNSPLASRGITLEMPSGQEAHVDMIINPLRASHEVEGLIVELMTMDRLMRISREESLHHTQETSQAVIRGLAHEIKNPLGGVRGAAQLLARELPNDDLAEYTNIIIREADRLRDLVDTLLGPNQLPDLRPMNIHEVLEHVAELVTAESGSTSTITRDYDPSLPELLGDRSQLVQAVLNITRNALQAADNLSSCRITLRTRPQRQFTIGNHRHRLVCQVDIIDNGPGVPDDIQHAIFAPMVTGRAAGTGLGLSIAQSIVHRHGGTLHCESEPGNTRFTLYLPMEFTHA